MDQAKIKGQIELLVQIVRCICLKRELSKLNATKKLNFWRVIQSSLFDQAVLGWTKVFGSNAEPSHWKGVVEDHNKFQIELLTVLGIDEEKWSGYWEEMKIYRNEAVAHDFDDTNITHHPTFDIALNSCHFYYGHLIKNLRDLGSTQFPDSLKEYSDDFTEQIRSIAEIAVNATKDIEERERKKY
ncbi:hypothetical protein [uncultured Shewanella sp.]|uniref:hypothetical protein n=1 Tax=uncultured Shewanella sp. TaxID=173975 RepID=UPI0026158198|nr:hypothetical protein [uncultured Shewanella sp.]